MEDDIMMCRNQKCKRKGIMVLRPAGMHKCSECGAKLKRPRLGELMADSTQPIVDPEPEPGVKLILPESDGVERIIPDQDAFIASGGKWYEYQSLLEKSGILPWADFRGNSMAHDEYLKACGVGSGKPVTPVAVHPDRIIRKHFARGGNIVPFKPKASDEFHCDPDVITDPSVAGSMRGCPLVTECPIVTVPNSIWETLIWLTKAIETEWLAYLKGRFVPEAGEDGEWVIDSVYFPKQKATSTHVEATEDNQVEEGTIGSIHSHVGMAAFFSAEDQSHFNHTIEMVLNRKGEYECLTRVELECHRFTRVKSKVMLSGDDVGKSMLADLKSKLTATTYHSHVSGGRGYNGPRKPDVAWGRHAYDCKCYDCTLDMWMEGGE
jgi:hypothetical protein